MMKYVIYLLCLLSLTACYYNPKTGCWIFPQSADCPMKNPKSNMQRYSKADGQPVSDEQKINDLKDCGATPDKYGNFWKDIEEKYPYNGGFNYGFEATKKVGECMKAKGYIYDNVYN